MAKILDGEYLTYDDVLLVPNQSLESRNSASYSQTIWNTEVDHPIIPANMDSISGEEMCRASLNSGGIAVLHRFMSVSERLKTWLNLGQNPRLFISIGVTPAEKAHTKTMLEAGVRRFCIDIAHGHASTVRDMIRFIKDIDASVIVMAGNIATTDGYVFLQNSGADIVKVGVGPGSHCTTRIVTGCGVPQFSAIFNIVEAFKNSQGELVTPVIADGGLKNAGDITKALAAGASFVMSGSFFAGCKEAPGEIVKTNDGSTWKNYRRMASKDAQVGWRGISEDDIVAEGESSLVPFKGSFNKVLHQLLGGLSSGMSYIGAGTLAELRRDSTFVRVTPNVLTENRAHGKM